jgi:hypothetical protein
MVFVRNYIASFHHFVYVRQPTGTKRRVCVARAEQASTWQPGLRRSKDSEEAPRDVRRRNFGIRVL